jgi:hypothetical protein
MNSRLLFTIATVACLTGVYAAYAVLTRPYVIVPEFPETSIDPNRHSIAHLPVENVRVAQTYLAEQSWAAESQYMLRAGQAFIYTQKYDHQAGDARIRFIPFAMVWLQKDKQGRETAVSLVSDSALLKFASAFDGINSNPGRVTGAVLDGEVQIKGPDGLAIAGKQFVFDESAPSLISTNLVQFQYGSHYGRGRTLNMKLIPAEGPPGRDRPHVFGVRTIRLGSGTDPITKKFDPVQLDVRMPQQGQQKLVKIRCSGDLEYDVENRTALFSQSVRAHSLTGGGGYDSLDCDKLWLQFEPDVVDPRAAAPAAPAAEDPANSEPRAYQQVDTALVFRRMIAEGERVKVVSTQGQMRADMKRLVYDAVERRLQLTDPWNVCVSQKGSTLWVPDVEVRFDEVSSAVTEVVCRGTGRLEMTRPETNELAFVATWVKQLRKSTDAASGLDFIELQQQASFRQPLQHTGLGAELIRLWLAPMSLSLPTGDDNSQAPAPEPQPKRLVAERDVALVSPQLVARTNELDVQFEEDAVTPRELGRLRRDGLQLVALEEQVEPAADGPRAQPNQRRSFKDPPGRSTTIRPATYAAQSPERRSLGPPIEIPLSDDPLPGGKPPGLDPRQKSVEPLEITSDRISVRMRRLDGQTEPELVEVETEGHMKIVQRRPSGEAPLTAEGDRLHLQNRGEGREIVHLFGQPAHLRDRGVHVEGREVHLDREANRVWVKGNGLLQLPVPPGTELESIGQATNDPDLDVWWEESMEFDGQTAKFIGKVRAELGLSRMRCEQMDVGLSSKLSFTDPRQEQQPDLRTIYCHENVTFENSAYEANKLVRVQRGRVAEFTLDRLKGESFAQGPGQMQVWQRGSGNQSPLAPRSVIQANRPINAVTSEWAFTKVDFKGRMTGNIDRQRSTFHDSVLIVHGPMNPPNTIDADHLPPLAGSMRCDKLEFTHKSKGPNQPKAYQQLVGWGNAQIEGRGFYANADEISFDGAKGLYMLRAHGNQSAMIAQDADVGGRREASGRRIEFIPATKSVRVDWATGAVGSP